MAHGTGMQVQWITVTCKSFRLAPSTVCDYSYLCHHQLIEANTSPTSSCVWRNTPWLLTYNYPLVLVAGIGWIPRLPKYLESSKNFCADPWSLLKTFFPEIFLPLSPAANSSLHKAYQLSSQALHFLHYLFRCPQWLPLCIQTQRPGSFSPVTFFLLSPFSWARYTCCLKVRHHS